MNEMQIRERVRQAMGEAPYPAYLSSRVESRLKGSSFENRGRARKWRVGIGRTSTFVLAVLAVLLIATIVAGVFVWRNADFNPRPVPGGKDQMTRYLALMTVDQQAFDATSTDHCTTLDDPACLDAQALITVVVQKWLDDLVRSQPPARFVAVDALIQRHLLLRLQDNIATIAAFKARDQKGFDTSVTAGHVERASLHLLAGDIIASSQATIAYYTAFVQLQEKELLDCAQCQQLISPTSVSCQVSRPATCVIQIAAVRDQLEAYLGGLVIEYAPDSLAANGERFQAVLLAADRALNAIASALSAGDPAALQAGRDGLRQDLALVQSEAAVIASSR